MGGFSRDLVRVYISSWWVLSHPSEKYATVKLDSIFANIGNPNNYQWGPYGLPILAGVQALDLKPCFVKQPHKFTQAKTQLMCGRITMPILSNQGPPTQMWSLCSVLGKRNEKLLHDLSLLMSTTMDVIFCSHKVSWSFMNLSRSWWVL